MKLKVLFLLNCEFPKKIAKFFPSVYYSSHKVYSEVSSIRYSCHKVCLIHRETNLIPVTRYVQKVLTYVVLVIRYVSLSNTSLSSHLACSEVLAYIIPVIMYVQKLLTYYIPVIR